MARTDLYLKVVVDHDAHERPEQRAAELCRQLMKIYGVRSAELTHCVSRSEEDGVSARTLS